MKKILIVEGNLSEENKNFSAEGIQTHTESLKDSISYFTDKLNIDVVNPSSDENINEVAKEKQILYVFDASAGRGLLVAEGEDLYDAVITGGARATYISLRLLTHGRLRGA